MVRTTILFALIVGCLSAPPSSLAWGPHPQITQAALDALGPDHPLKQRLGIHARRLPQYCWMADWRQSLLKVGDTRFYADDFLLYPAFDYHVDHLCPHVEKSYAPYLKRAVEALRMESPENAARWIGAILHFVEDTGSPPHSARVLGDLHRKGENWVKGDQITIAGYRPKLLGKTIPEAAKGLQTRMAGLIEFSKARFERVRPFLEADDREATEPIVLESANETARVVADLFHTLGHLADNTAKSGGTIAGVVKLEDGVPDGPVTKVVVMGTDWSTLVDAKNNFHISGLAPGKHTVQFLRHGAAPARVEIDLKAATTNRIETTLKPGSLARNADFRQRWVNPNRPDCWRLRKDHWNSEWIPLAEDRSHEIEISWQDGKSAPVEIIYAPKTNYGAPQIRSKPLTPAKPNTRVKGGGRFAFARVVLKAPDDPRDHWRFINIRIAD